jgi:hypothetical protein
VCDYVHLNPVRAKLLGPRQAMEAFAWSSYGDYLRPRKQRWPWLRVDRLLGEWGIPKDSPAGRDQFAQRMEVRRRQETGNAEWKTIERGWYLGDQAFKQELLAQMRASRGDHYGLELREADEVHAEKLVKAELRRRHWPEGELARRRKGDPQKVEIAWRLRRETPMTLKWIAARLNMGVWTSVSNALARKRSKDQKCQ